MRLIAAVAVGTALLGACAASPTSHVDKYVLHEERDGFGHWSSLPLVKRARLTTANTLSMRIGLAQRDLDQGYDWLMDVSHPQSKNYGKHWSSEQVNKAFAPTAETVQTVRNWLIKSGIHEDRITVSDNKGWLAFEATVEEAEELLRTQYYEHQHADADKYTVGCDEYYLPEHVTPHIDYITPGVKHQVYKRAESPAISKRDGPFSTLVKAPYVAPPIGALAAKAIPLNCSSYVVNTDCIRALYNMDRSPNYGRSIPGEVSFGIYESIGESYSQADLDLFFANYAPYVPNGTFPTLASVDGGIGPVAQDDSGGEAMLDFTLAYALTYPQSLTFFSVDDLVEGYTAYGFGDTLLDAIDGSFCTYSAFGQKGNNNTIDPVYPDPAQGGYKGPLMCGTYQPPKVMSVSYSEGESYLPVNYIKRQCNEWMKLSLQGMTTVFSSGDSGVSTRAGSYGFANGCINNTIFTPAVWNECPYVLSVGATTIRVNQSGYSSDPEEAVYAMFKGATYPYTSGAGFSNIFPRPSYQNAAVKNWFSNYNPGYPTYTTTNGQKIGNNGGLYNRGGRAYPDISANGAWWHVYLGGNLYRYGGTSMSAPLVASMISLINEARIGAGKSPVGWVQPTFYAHPEAFQDITYGSNEGCGYAHAFNCTPGWDPPTGLGTPKFAKLKSIFMSLP